MREQFQDGVLWASLGRNGDVSARLAEWAVAIGIPKDEIGALTSLADRRRAIQAIIGSPQKRMLLVIDDAWESTVLEAFKVGGVNSVHLLTTRLHDVAIDFVNSPASEVVSIPELSEDEGLALLRGLVPAEVVESEPHQSRFLIRAVGGLPLALILMSKYLAKSYKGQRRRIRTALEELQKAESRLQLEHTRSSYGQTSLQTDVPPSLLAIIGISDEALDADASYALRALSLFPPKPNSFSEEAALAVSAAPIKTLDTLVDYGLLESVRSDGWLSDRYRLHQTIADYARTKLTDTTSHERMVSFFVNYTESNAEDDAALSLETNNISATLQIASERGMQSDLVRGTSAFFRFLLHRGLYRQAEEYLDRALEPARHLAKQADMDFFIEYAFLLAAILLDHATLSLERKDYVRGGAYAEEGLTVIRDLKSRLSDAGERDAEAISTLLSALANVLSVLGVTAAKGADYSRAESFYQEALAVARETSDNMLIVRGLMDLAMFAVERREYEQADTSYKDALRLARENGNYSIIMNVLLALYRLEYSRWNIEQADTYISQVEELVQKELDNAIQNSEPSISEHVGTIRLLLDIAIFEHNRGHYAVAREYVVKALAIANQSLGVLKAFDDLKGTRETLLIQEVTIDTLGVLANLEVVLKHYEQARQYMLDALLLSHEIGHPGLISEQMLAIGVLESKHGDYSKAEEYFKDALHFAYEVGHYRLISKILQDWGQLYLKQQNLGLASKAFSDALQVARNISNLDLVASALYSLAQVASAQGRIQKAQDQGQESLQIFEALHDDRARGVKGWLSRLSKEDAMHRFRPQLTAPLFNDWIAKESITLISPDSRANVIASSEPIDEGISTQQYAESQGYLIKKEFPGYQEFEFTPTQVLGGRPVYIRYFRWNPPDSDPITQIQLYYVENARGYTATATARSDDFEEFETQLRRILEELLLEL